MLRISGDEYQRRLEALRSAVGQMGLDLFLVSAFDSLYYLTGAGFFPLERPFFLLVWPDRAPSFIVPKLDQEHMKKAHNLSPKNIHAYREYPAPVGCGWLDQLRDHRGAAREIGVEPSLPQDIAQQLTSSHVRIVPLVESLRLLKSKTEIQMIRRAARYADFGVERLLAASYFGSTVAEGFAETRTVTSRIIREVDDWEPLTSNVVMATWAAPGSVMPHSIPALSDRLEEGPHVALVLTRVNGYAAESERTYFTALPSGEAMRAFAAIMEARRIAFAMIRPGVGCSELDATVTAFLRKEGYGHEDQRLHRTGHGLGLGNHEAPWVAEGSNDRLEENMVISIEPGIYLKGLGGFRHSDTVLVTKDGHESLTQAPTHVGPLVIRSVKPWTRVKGWLVRRALRLKQKAGRVKRASAMTPSFLTN